MSKYRTISAKTREKLQDKVQKLVDEGYKPLGGMSSKDDGKYHQTVFKEDGGRTDESTSGGKELLLD